MWQYKTLFACPECGEHYFQTDEEIRTGPDFNNAECTNCGFALSEQEIARQMQSIPPTDLQRLFTR